MPELVRQIIHYTLHLVFPGIIAWIFFREQWKKVWLVFVLTMLMDMDHLLSIPVFDSKRCSINFHILHTYLAAVIYATMVFFKRTRILGIGALWHLLTDLEDCLWIS